MVLRASEVSSAAPGPPSPDGGPNGLAQGGDWAVAPVNRESRLGLTLRYLRRNPRLLAGLSILLFLLLFWLVGSRVMDTTARSRPLSGPPDMEPSAEYWLGTDTAGRELLPVLIEAT